MPARRVCLTAAVLVAGVLLPPATADAAASRYATAPAALRAAIRDAVARQAPHAPLGGLRVDCGTPVAAGETTACDGYFAVHARGGAPPTYYVVVRGTGVTRRDAGTLAATLVARPDRPRLAARRHLPARLTAVRVLAGPAPPAERTVHADVVIQHGARYGDRRLSRDRWLGFAVPFWYAQAYAEGPVTLPGTVSHVFDFPPGAHCEIQVGAGARVTATPPREEPAGRLSVDPAIDDSPDGAQRPRILDRSAAPGDVVTYTIAGADPRSLPSIVRVQPAPAGLGPPSLRWLVITADVAVDLERLGQPGPDGYPVLDPLPAQIRGCDAAAAAVAATVPPRIVATATITARPRPPRADPDDEAPTPVEPSGYGPR